MKKEDIINKKFGRLTPLKIVGKKSNKQNIWQCKCDCGNIKNIAQSNFTRTSHPSRSCGCLNKEISSKIHKGHTRRRLSPGESGFNDLYNAYKSGAERRNLEFNLTKELFKQITKLDCYYCGDKPNNKITITAKTEEASKHSEYIYNGIDRLDNNIGYIVTNIVTCCKQCNYMKHSYSYQDFINKCKTIAERFS